jgi:hypothetical protein
MPSEVDLATDGRDVGVSPIAILDRFIELRSDVIEL